MINKVSRSFLSSKKRVFFFVTRDLKNRTYIGTRFLLNVATKKIHSNVYLNEFYFVYDYFLLPYLHR